MRQEGLAVAALLVSVRKSGNVAIYYINGALLKLNRYALYFAKRARFCRMHHWSAPGQNFWYNYANIQPTIPKPFRAVVKIELPLFGSLLDQQIKGTK